MSVPGALSSLFVIQEQQTEVIGVYRLLDRLINDLFVVFNIKNERTLSDIDIAGGDIIPLDVKARKYILEEVAGTLADQGHASFSNAELEGKIALIFGPSTNDAVVRDIRTQTVL